MRKLCAVRLALWLTLLTFIIFQLNLSGQNIQFERVPNDLGLSQNLISCLIQDRHGFIWVGTKDGLNRFDGYEFKVWRNNPFDSTSVSDNYIKSVFEDSHGRLWTGTANGLSLMDRGRETFHRLPVQDLSHPDVIRILEDKEGNIWLATRRGGLNLMEIPPDSYDLSTAKITHFRASEAENSLWEDNLKGFTIDESGAIWVMSDFKLCVVRKDTVLNKYVIQRMHWEDIDPQWPNYKQSDFTYSKNGEIFIDRRYHNAFEGNSGRTWFRIGGGFARRMPHEDRFHLSHVEFDKNDYLIPPLRGAHGAGLEDKEGRLWVGGTWALVVVDPLTHKIVARHHNDEPPTMGIPRVGIQSLLEDRTGTIWAGTNGKGLYKYTPQLQRFSKKEKTTGLPGKSIRSIYETRDGIVWIGTTDLRLYHQNRETGLIQPTVLDNRWKRTHETQLAYVYTMHEDRKGNFWIGTEEGLFQFKKRTGGQIEDWTFHPVYLNDGKNETLCSVTDIHEDSEGKIWLITRYEFGKFDPENGYFDGKSYLKITQTERNTANLPCIYQQKNGNFWLGTEAGLLKFETGSEQYSLYVNDPKNPKSLSQNKIKTILPDPSQPEKILWLGTAGGGLNRFDLETESFSHFTTADGLPDNVIYGILNDRQNRLWMSTNQGLARFNPNTKTFRNYIAKDGLQDNEFNSLAYFKSEKGELFFGGINGFNAFFPEDISDNNFVPNIVLTDFQISNQSVDLKAPDSPLQKDISETEAIVLSHKDNIFSFEFAALDLTNSVKNQYAYKLENFDEEWQYIGTKRTVTFTNIEPGEYIFKVKGTNHDGVWNEEGTSLKITILPPWWKTWWAYLGYFILLASGVLFLYKFQLNRQLERAETKRLTELDALKTRLYNNITHEFRTPLTVIMGMTEQLATGKWQSAVSKKEQEEIGKGFSLIRRNGNNLLRLINQMLDLSKLESGTMKLDAGQSDIIGYLQYLTESFFSMAQEKNIRLVFYPEMPKLIMDFDENKLQHVVYNLLSNAIKFTENGGKIVFHANKEIPNGSTCLKLKIADTGIGISSENLENIFNRFYQVDDSSTRKGEGTGIGLALTKELVELMGGKIFVESEVGKGTTFTILLPIKNEAELREIHKDSKPVFEKNSSELNTLLASGNSKKSSDLPLVLIVEDNPDVATYIRQILEKDYQCVFAQNGQKGIETALETIPDIIISDVMMPEKDGFELTETLKKDERTSHIPIILLTAKATEEDKIIGLKTGADAYLMKPFNKDELFIRLEKLVQLRLALQSKYLNGNFEKATETKPITELTIEDIFLQKLQKTVEEKMDDPNLNPEILAKSVHLSQSQLYRKLKALTNDSPNYFIRKIRLRKALELLKKTDMNVSEVAYEVGFNDPNYFSRVFHKEFGKSPSVFNK